MSIWQTARRALDRAKVEASGAARTARVHMDVRSLEGQRDRLYERLGRKVYAARTNTEGPASLDRLFGDIDRLEELIREQKAELASARAGRSDPGNSEGAEAR